IAAAARKHDLAFGVSSHRAENWWFFDGGRLFPSDVQDDRYAGLYGPAVKASPDEWFDSPKWASADWRPRPDAKHLDDWLARCCELVDKFQPQIFYFDGWIGQAVFEPYVQKFAAYYYNRAEEFGKEVIIQHKSVAFPKGSAVFDIERG